MHIESLIWDDWNIEHIADHGVEPYEVEDVCFSRPLVRRAKKTRYGLQRYHAFGQTIAGRYLFIVLDREAAGLFYVVPARDVSKRELRQYRQKRG
ncbi:MAG: BrnT family toxin [Chloroflexota bacterium]|nr:BrnT family toxin [Chloroflexota bacterium]